MTGQLWEECHCGTEPCCANCHQCKRHCDCGKPPSVSVEGPAPLEVFVIGENREENDL